MNAEQIAEAGNIFTRCFTIQGKTMNTFHISEVHPYACYVAQDLRKLVQTMPDAEVCIRGNKYNYDSCSYRIYIRGREYKEVNIEHKLKFSDWKFIKASEWLDNYNAWGAWGSTLNVLMVKKSSNG